MPHNKLKFVGHSEASAPRQQSIAYSQAAIILIGLCFIFSGSTGLIYEVLWARMLGLVFGATTLAVSTVLAAFMGGLALGSALAGRFGSRIKRPLSAYGWLEIGIAIYAILVPPLALLVFLGIMAIEANYTLFTRLFFFGASGT